MKTTKRDYMTPDLLVEHFYNRQMVADLMDPDPHGDNEVEDEFSDIDMSGNS